MWGGRRQTYTNPEAKLWLERMGEKGWTAPTWPTEYGGGGLSRQKAKVLDQEMARIKARAPLFSFGLWMLGPVLLEYANEEQKKEHLPKIVQRRDPLVPGLFRTRRGLGSREPAERAARTRAITS